MKNKFSKLISALLIFAFLVSAMSIFSFGAEGEGEGTTSEEYTLFFNRNYEDGWEFDNGFSQNSTYSKPSGHNFFVDYEEDVEYNYNYFFRVEADNSANEGFESFDFSSYVALEGKTVVEFDIKADDVATLGDIVNLYTGVGKKKMNLLHVNTTTGDLIVFNSIPESHKGVACSVIDEKGKENTGHPNRNAGGYCPDCGNCAHGSYTDVKLDYVSYLVCDGCGAIKSINLGKLDNEWKDLAFVFDWGKMQDGAPFKCTLFWGENYEYSIETTFGYEVAGDKAAKAISFGVPGVGVNEVANRIGMSFCIDNLKVYQGEKLTGIDPNVNPADYGTMVGLNTEKTVNIQQGAGYKSKAEILEQSLCMKIGVEYALFRNERRAIYDGTYGAPVKHDGHVMVPLKLLLEYIGFPFYQHPDLDSWDITTGLSATYITANRSSAVVAGERVELSVAPTYFTNDAGTEKFLTVAVEDVEVLFPGWLVVYDEMGLVIIYEDTTPDDKGDNEDIVNRKENLDTMVDLMKKFVFDTKIEAKAEDTYNTNGLDVVNAVTKKTSLAHPYIIADQATFDNLKNVYGGEASAAKTYLASIIAEAEEIYADKAIVNDGAYAGIKATKLPVNQNSDGLEPTEDNPDIVPDSTDGYNLSTGYLREPGEYAKILPTLAFAYQVTRDTKYARLAYDWSVVLASWEHWGPSNFSDLANVATPFAISYDWLYNAYKTLGLDTTVLAQALFDLGVHDGYIASRGFATEHPSSRGDFSKYTTYTDSRNVVGSSAMIISSIAILDYISLDETMLSEAVYVIGNNLVNLSQNGLFDFAPDGAHLESAKHWEISVTALSELIMTLESSMGNDYGFSDTWGLDKTCYYALQIESSDGYIWNYGDVEAGITTIDTSVFNFLGKMLGDAQIVAARQNQLESGKKTATIYDLLFYPFEGTEEFVKLPLDYKMDGVEGFVSRSDWSDGALYTGIMGGSNANNNSQLDSGNFIYTNKGINWFVDLGSDNTNIKAYTEKATRYKYYRTSAEGQNVVVFNPPNSADITSKNPFYSVYPTLAAGQSASGGGVITKTDSNEYGSYAIINNHGAYAGVAETAYRGIFVTNDRKTVVIQDEIDFSQFETLAWVAHTGYDIRLDESGKTAFLTAVSPDGNTYVLRASIVSKVEFTFTVKRASDDPFLTNTYGVKAAAAGSQYSRDDLQVLMINSEEGASFHVAVVFEIVSDYSNNETVGYTWTAMHSWEPYSSESFAGGENVVKRAQPNSANISSATTSAASLLKKPASVYSSDLEKLYEYLSEVAYLLTVFPEDTLTDSKLVTSAGEHRKQIKKYDKYRSYLADLMEKAKAVSEKFIGFEAEVVEEEEEEED